MFHRYCLSGTLRVLSFVNYFFRIGNTDPPYLSHLHKQGVTLALAGCIAQHIVFF
jgi:hypothetical protein